MICINSLIVCAADGGMTGKFGSKLPNIDWYVRKRGIKVNNLYELFVSVCERVPDSTALVYHEKIIDYKTLRYNVEKIYGLLLANGIQSGDVVGLSVKRSPNAVAAMLAVLKAGAAYMPFNPLQSTDEWKRMMEESGGRAVVNDHVLDEKFFDGIWIEPEEFEYQADRFTACVNPEGDYLKNLAYVIYTSGSTGRSKGVGIRQESLLNLILYGTEEIGLTQGQSILAISNFAFDMSVPETIMAVLTGMSIILLDEEEAANPRLTRRRIQDRHVSTLLITPTRMSILLSCKKGTDFLRPVKHILFGAEMISSTLTDKLKKASEAQIFNLYGPTETTAYLTYSNITDKDVIDIGKPIKNTFIYLIDEEERIIEGPGEGEILIAGIGVSDGYLVPDEKKAFRSHPDLAESLVYHTGDIAKRSEDGELVYLGRRDNQVKYRGYRLGLEEIENKIRSQVIEIQDCVALVHKHVLDEYLILVYVSSVELELSCFRRMVEEHLASYAIPTNLIRVNALPLNKNGKIDRKEAENLVDRYFASKQEGSNL